MFTYQKRINELQPLIENNNYELRQNYETAGERFSAIDIKIENNREIENCLGELEQLNIRVHKKEIQLDQLNKTAARTKDISKMEKELKEEISKIEKENRMLGSRKLEVEEGLKVQRDIFLSIWMEKLVDLGFFLYNKKIGSQDNGIKMAFTNISRLLARKNELSLEMDKCRAEISIEHLEEEIREKDNFIADLNKKIVKLESENNILRKKKDPL